MSIMLMASSITTLHHHRPVWTGLHHSPRCPPQGFPGINHEDMEVIQTMEGIFFGGWTRQSTVSSSKPS